MAAMQNFAPSWRTNLLVVFSVMSCFAASGMALTPVYNQQVRNSSFHLSKNDGNGEQRQRDLVFHLEGSPNEVNSSEHHNSLTDKISDSTITFDTTNSIQTQNIRVKRDANDVSGTVTSPSNATSGSFPPVSVTTSAETASELSETTVPLAPTTEVQWTSETPATGANLTASSLILAASTVSVTEPTKSSESTTETTDQTYTTENTTPVLSVCPEISGLVISEVSDGEIQISWNLSPQNATNFRNVCVEVISLRTAVCEKYRRYLECFNETITSAVVSNLCHFSHYNISVSLECDGGNWTKCTQDFETRTAVPTEPTNLRNGTVTNRTIALEWSPPDFPNGNITNYTIYWATISGSENSDTSQQTSYIIRNLNPYTKYNISVSAWTSAGESEKRAGPLIIETEQGIPTEPRNLENRTVTNTTVVLNWSLPSFPNGKITKYTVYWTSSDTESSDTSQWTSYTVKNLSSYTNYTFSVSAWTLVGESMKKAGPLRIQTEQGIPDPPEEVKITEISNTTITLQWFPPNISRGVITSYSVYWKKTNSGGNYDCKNTTKTTLELKDLMPYTNYSLKVTARTIADEGAASEEVVQQTLEGIPDSPENVEFSEVLNTTMTVKWSSPSIIKGVITNYSVYWKILDTTENYQTDVTDKTTMQVKNLKPFTNYTVKVSAWTAVGEGPAFELTAKTKEGIPGQPLNLTVHEGTNVSVILRWSPPVHQNGKIVKYDVSWSFSQEDNVVKKTAATNETFLLIGDLSPYVNYTLSASARTAAGEGSASDEVRYQTDVGAPSKPQNLSVSYVGTDVLILSWEKPQQPRGPITGYIFNWEGDENFSIFEDTKFGEVSMYQVEKLKPFTNYTLWVTPFNINRKKEALRSEISGVVEAQTAEGIPSSPTDFRVEAFTNTTFDVTWQSPETPNGIILAYTVYWQSADGDEDKNHTNTSDTRYVIPNLNSFTKYNLTVTATTGAGEGPAANATLGKTDVGVPSAPRNGTVLDVDDERILVEWKKPEFQHGPIAGFTVCWRKHIPDNVSNATCHDILPSEQGSCDDFNTVVTEQLYDQNTTAPFCQYHIVNLDPWTNYVIEIKAYNKNQFKNILEGPAEVILQQTAAAVPEEPILDSVKVVSSTAVVVKWNYIGRYPGPLEYAIYLEAKADRCTAHDRRNVTDGLRNLEARVAGLKPFTNYDFRVFASTRAGSSSSEKTITVRTNPDVPGMPKNVQVNCSYSPTKAYVSWRTPDRENGLIEEYKILYRPEGSENDYEKAVITVDDPKLCFKQDHEAELENLHPETTYEISVMGKTKDTRDYGESARSNEQCSVPAGVPPFPKNNTLPDVRETNQQEATFTFSKTTFSTEMGKIIYYALIVGFSHVIGKPTNGSTDEAANQKLPVWNQFWKETSKIYQATPENWNPFEGNDYDPLHCQSDPDPEGDLFFCTIGWEKNCSEEEETYCNGPLKPGTRYGIKLRGFTAAGFSETSPIFISTASIKTSSPAGIIVGLLLLFLLLIVTAIAIVLDKRNNYRMLNRIRNFLLKKDPSAPGCSQDVEVNDIGVVNSEARSQPMDFATFLEHVKVMMSDSFLRFSLEYEDIKQNSPKHPCTAAEMEENRAKNRWMNIFPFDHSRVKLLPIDDEPSSDYINANYIPGFTSHRAYIATQGPLPNTVDDFWRMVWEQSVTMIVMLTQCVERGKKKCEQYWPSDSDNVYYGDLKIQLKSESILSSYCIRIFDLQLGTKQHTVKQMHFTKWPDFGSPESPEDLINFVQAVRDHLPHTNTGPILVHCSAGVGRTGTFIAVDRLLQHIQYYNEINIYNTVVEMRQYRTNMVQTEDQYIYIHKCMRDIISQKLCPRASIYDEDGDSLYSNINIKTTEL